MCVLSRLLYGDIARISLDLAPLSGSSATKDPLPYTTTTTTNSARNSPSGSTASSLWNWVYSWLPPWKGKSDPTSDPLFSDGSSSSNTNTYPLESEDETKQAAAGSSSRRLAFYQSKTRRNGNDDEDWLSAPDCTVLFPFEGNVHEFSAGPEGAAILDVLIPPYDVDRDRDCTYYEIKDYFHYATAGLAAGTDTHPVSNSSRSSSSSTLHSVEKFTTSSTITTDHDRRNGTTLAAACDPSSSAAVHHFGGDPCWIVPMEQPDDFHCVSGTYNGLGEE